MENTAVAPVVIRKFNGHSFTDMEDLLAIEEPLEIQIVYGPEQNRTQKNIAVTMRTPGHDKELAIGFLFTEGIIRAITDLESEPAAATGNNSIRIGFAAHATPLLHNAQRNFFTTSSCGVCGKSSIDAIRTISFFEQLPAAPGLPAAFFQELQDALQQRQEVFAQTGGLHAAALFNAAGELLLLREDVGRHNAVDKLIGAAFLQQQLPLHNHILLLSGRASFELVQKAVMAGIRIIAAVGAPSSLAVQLATDCDITLIGFLRKQHFNIYSVSQRISLP